MRKLIPILMLLLCSLGAAAQAPQLFTPGTVTPFLNAHGQPCAGCWVYFYVSGTTTPQDTYTDATAGTKNTNPIQLNAAGFAETSGGAQVGIWLINGDTYRVILETPSHVQIYLVDGIFAGIPSVATAPLLLTGGCDQISIIPFGGGNNTSLCFPVPSSPIRLTFPNSASDTMVARNTSDTLTNKNLTLPTFNGTACPIVNAPGTYLCVPNANPGPVTNGLVSIISGLATTAPTGTTSIPVVGICVQNCTQTGNAVIQQSGVVNCFFVGGTNVGDYVQVSGILGEDCADVGSGYPEFGQVLGIVLSSNIASGDYQMLLFPPNIRPNATPLPILSIVAGTGAGTSPTINCVNCYDSGGVIAITPGSSPAASATLVTLTFHNNYGTLACTVSPGTATSATLSGASQIFGGPSVGPPSTLVLFSGATPLTASTTYDWNYACNFSK